MGRDTSSGEACPPTPVSHQIMVYTTNISLTKASHALSQHLLFLVTVEVALDRQDVEASLGLSHSWKNLCSVSFRTLLTYVTAWCINSALPRQQGSLKRFHELQECEDEVREKGGANCSPSASSKDVKRSKNWEIAILLFCQWQWVDGCRAMYLCYLKFMCGYHLLFLYS